MANASAKRIASQNEQAIRSLRLGMGLSLATAFLIRLIWRRNSLLPPSLGLATIFVSTLLPSIFIYRYLEKIGTTRRDPTTGTLLSSGEDLAQPGVTEWCFDILYITWACQIGSAIFGEWFWWFYLIIPIYAIYKVWTSFISPMFFGRAPSTSVETAEEDNSDMSRRQQKLRKRNERGDPRVRSATAPK
ncbi:putative opsin [Rickenella mellea]|uniref:Putative opsin n=1 Tax=Rickenella mellea TaxID=50990 RepID=A0A4V3AZJ2_9AGAM|nr:putative opsin [Rickenella mellea]